MWLFMFIKMIEAYNVQKKFYFFRDFEHDLKRVMTFIAFIT